MIVRPLDNGAPAPWVAGDEVYGAEVYGADPALRKEVEDRGVGYVLAVARSHPVTTAAGKRRADELAASLPKHLWQRVSAGRSSKGPRFYDWAWIHHQPRRGASGHRWLLIRRNNSTGELAYYRCDAPQPLPLPELVRVAGRRWTVEESFQASKSLAGLDQHQVRRWVSWQRWAVLDMLAYALLAVHTERAHNPAPDGLIALTCNEIHHLFNVLITQPIRNLQHRLRWSTRPRRHQHRAKTSHYRRRGAPAP